MNKNYDEEYREPIPARRQNLMYGDDFEDFNEYKRNIMSRQDLDIEMKTVLIQTREDFLRENMPELLVGYHQFSNEKPHLEYPKYNDTIQRSNDLVCIVENIRDIEIINKPLADLLRKKLGNYVSGSINKIILDNESYLNFENILIKINLNEKEIEQVNKIIVPEDKNSLDEYKQIIEQSKKDWEILQEKIKLEQEAIQLKKELEQTEKNKRIENTNLLLTKIIKIKNWDKDANDLENILQPLFENYNNLLINKVKLPESDLLKVKNFLSKSRYTEQEKTEIIGIFE